MTTIPRFRLTLGTAGPSATGAPVMCLDLGKNAGSGDPGDPRFPPIPRLTTSRTLPRHLPTQ
ncbi:hypothetical protein BJV77DRAFT_973438 [Russula vinacea]|nr:hypothetical protein BJV77DRAFT_1048103 [Russula vinacea]KAH9981601.1 hypothetical protein BJV77DRAFT_1046799 [Russula vinacea]KAH9989548.1 hypothetical protein BJV77DRAFT_1016312 [Russula vinacea]KAH9989959.1 hypothetical protein BJV77DRAFT_1015046 [Russula vinacea]KAH9993548.1 hypothetical protein BJV77DRAFT_997441 [Russula vinacea]